MGNRSMQRRRKLDPWVLAFACVLPTLVTLVYFVWAASWPSGVQQVVFSIAKVVQFSLPVVWTAVAWRERLGWPRWSTRGMGLGIAFGLAVAAALWLLYWGLQGQPLLEQALQPIREKIREMGVDSPVGFIALGVFYSLFHSLLEEYYWRWFVFSGMRQYVNLSWAIVISSLAFAAHHVVVLWAYFAHSPGMTIFLALCVAMGGGVWAWLYSRSESIFPAWISHLLVDAAIFSLGFHLAGPLFSG